MATINMLLYDLVFYASGGNKITLLQLMSYKKMLEVNKQLKRLHISATLKPHRSK